MLVFVASAKFSCLISNQKEEEEKNGPRSAVATDAFLTADPGAARSIPARFDTFIETEHEIISTVIPLPSAESF